MNKSHVSLITDELHLTLQQVQAVASLLEEDASIPFIARYRKEATGSLDEVSIASIRDRLGQLQDLDSRRSAILNSLEQHGHLTDEIEPKRHGRTNPFRTGGHLSSLSTQTPDPGHHGQGKRA